MKRIVAAALCGLLLCTACAKAPEPVGLPNPMVEVTGSKDFEPLNIYIDAPAGATEVSYFIIDDALAHISFSYEGKSYVYRAAHTDEDISGVYETFDEEALGVEADGENWYASVTVRTIDGGDRGALATWAYGTAHFTLFTSDPVQATQVSDLAVALAQTQCGHYAD